MNRTRKTIAALIVTGAAGLGVIGCGSSSNESTTQAAATEQATTAQPGSGTAPRGGPAALTTVQLTTAAKQLDTTAAKLKAAITAAEGQRGAPGGTSGSSGSGATGSSGQRPTGDPRTALYDAVAKTLGTTSAKVKAALAGVLPSPPNGGQGGTPPSGQGGTPPNGAGGTPPDGQSGTPPSGASS